jgi:HEAT repeat protein
MNEPHEVDLLVAALEDEDSMVRWGTAKSLVRIGDPRALQPLLAALEDEDPVMRGMVASGCMDGVAALRRDIDDPRAWEPLLAALRTSERQSR